MTTEGDTIEKLTYQRDLLRKGIQRMDEINVYWVTRSTELERENRRLRERLKRLTKKVQDFTQEVRTT